jgi:cell division protein FtsI (penicillin-binding protein 3)
MNAAFKRRRARIGTLTLMLSGLFVLAALRLVVLVVLDGPRLNSLARSEHTGELEISAPRGPIVDRQGSPLALSAETRSVYARPKKVLEGATPAQRAKLAKALGLSASELASRLAGPAPFVWLARRMAPERAEAIEALGIDGVGTISEYKRFYPESALAQTVVGLAGMDGQGLSGIELEYDRMIRGEPATLHFYRDALGHPILDSPLALTGPVPGARIELTIDSDIQSLAEAELENEVHESGARSGSAIVLDPFTGEVLAMANVRAVPDRLHDRLHNPAIQDAFEPGSTMKGVLGAIALQDRAVTPDRKIYCEDGAYEVGGRIIHDHGRHGWLELGEIIEVSSNIGAAKVALSLGPERYYEGLRAFGIGHKTGIDLPGEASGLLRPPSTWREIDLANHGFGQGVAVTPIQLATAYAAIANGGVVLRPYVVKAAYDAEGQAILTHTTQVIDRAASPAVAHTMNVMLQSVVAGSDGTARLARVDGFAVAGKTGTAQMVNPATRAYYQNRLVASFVGFLPAENPRLVILVVLQDVGHGHFGGLIAAPVFSAIASGSLRHLDVAAAHPAYDVASMMPAGGSDANAAEAAALPRAFDDVSVAVGSGKIPNFVGLSLRRAIELARRTGINIDVDGSGYVIRQKPAAGAKLASQPSAVKLALAPVLTTARAGAPDTNDGHARSASWREAKNAREAE